MITLLCTLLGAMGGFGLAWLVSMRRTPRSSTASVEPTTQERRDLLERLNLTTRTVGIATWGMDIRTREVSIDEYMWSLYGTTPTSDPRVLFGFVHEDDRAALQATVDRAIADGNGMTTSARHRIRRGDGEERHMQTHVRVILDESGAAVRLLGVTWDVTEDTVRALQLQQQADDLRTVVERFNAAIQTAGFSPWEIDARTGRFTWAENRLSSFGLGALSVEEYGLAYGRMIHPEDHADLVEAGKRAIRDKQPSYSYRYRFMRPDGLVRHMQAHVRIIRDSNEHTIRLLGSTTDITNEVHTNELLQRQAEQERLLLDRLAIATQAAGISSWEIDLAQRRFLWLENPLDGAQAPEDDSLEAFSRLQHPDDTEQFVKTLHQAIREKSERLSYRYRTYTADGRTIHAQVSARLMRDDQGRVVRLLGVTWDVTREVEAATQIAERAAHERMLLDRLSIATQVADISSWQLDLRTREFLWVENPIASLAPKDPSDVTVNSLLEITHPEDRNIAARAIEASLAAGSDRISHRYRVITPDDRIVHIQNYSKIIFDDSGRPTSLLGASWDVTREVEASQKLEEQARQLRDIERRLERASLSSSEGHWEFDISRKTLWLSKSYHALLGYDDGTLPTTIAEFQQHCLHPDDLASSMEAIERHLSAGTPYVIDHRLRTARGEYRWIRTRGSTERNAQGQPVLMSGSIHDIQEQKLAEVALRHAQERFERAIAGTQDGLWETEADGSAWSSPRLAQLLGFDEMETGASVHFLRDRLHPDDVAMEADIRHAHLRKGQPYDVELRLQMRHGEYRWFRVRGQAGRDASGPALRFSGSLQDVSEARAARDELLQATEAAEAANRAKSDFLANVSHEIRTPMNGIIGMTGLLLDTALDRTQRDYAETIRGSADSLLIVINDILDFSKIEAGKLDMESIEMDLAGNVEDVGGTMAFQAAARNLDLIVHVHPDVPGRVLGDPQRLRQCLINLVGNAIKFTKQGEIVIEVSRTGRRDGRTLVQFEVRDTGIGIAPDTLKSLFQPFVQADSSTTRHFGGTGLGLSIVRRLVEMMGGDVGVDSEVGKGSTFWFTLPMEPVAQATMAVPIDLARLGRRVLVVDDQETNRRVLAGQLMHAGYEVSLASGGHESLRMMRQALADNHPFEVVLVDYRMHDMDGAMLGEQINADAHLSQARVVVLTSVDRHGDVRRFASLGFAGYLTKPVRTRELFDCMDRVLSRDAREWHMQSQPLVTRSMLNGSGEQGRRYQGRVLLVEDNAVNQKVAVRFLERLGCSVRVADNGAEGVKAWQEGSYDLVLMDLQMPVMDGLTATKHIRELERGQPGPPTQIVALTANAMAGQLEICLRAGMNDFLTKPLQIARLHETLDRLGLAASSETPTAEATSTVAQGTPVDLSRVRELTDGDDEFAEELSTTFINSGEQVLQEIVAALDDLDRIALSRAAHKLKGASANICAEPLRQLASDLETNGAGLDQQRLRELVFNVAQEFRRTAQFLEEQVIRDRKAG